MVEKKDIVMIKVERETRKRLMARGKKGDSYEDVITALLDDTQDVIISAMLEKLKSERR